MSHVHLSAESATAHAYELTVSASEARHLDECAECARRVRAIRMDRAALTRALGQRAAPKPRVDRWAALAAAIVIVVSAGAVGYALMLGRGGTHPATAQDVERWIGDMGSDEVERRERATAELRERGASAEGALRKALERGGDPETRGRIEALLRAVEVTRRQQLACVTARGIDVLALDGSSSMRVAEHGVAGVLGLTWSPDGRWIAYVDAGAYVHVLDAHAGGSRALGQGGLGHAVWSPDGKRLAWGGRTGVLVADTDAWSVRQVAGAGGFACFWSADGAQLYVHSGTLSRVDVETGKSEAVAEAVVPATASADRTKIVFLGMPADGRRGYSTYTYPLRCLDVTTGRVATLASGVSREGEQLQGRTRVVPPECPVISPDGSRVAFVRTGKVCLVGTGGGDEKALGDGQDPAWSPDGARLAYARPDGRTVVVDVATGSEFVVEGWAPAWSPVAPRR